MTSVEVDTFLASAAGLGSSAPHSWDGELRCGVDLGTASIVLTLIDEADRPIYVDQVRREAIRDGIVVDFHAAVQAVRELVAGAEAATQTTIESAATAFPPCVSVSDSRACRFVLEQAGLECRSLVDEVSAAQALLNIDDGVVVDVGGGSTGVGCYRGGELFSLGDLPGGGHQLNLILAGALKVTPAEAELEKRHNGSAHLPALKPGIERVAHNVRRLMPPDATGPIHLVGGALMIPGAGRVVENFLHRAVVEHPHALLVTPFGIAFS
jgi:ethanolamine utilization protein EutJ